MFRLVQEGMKSLSTINCSDIPCLMKPAKFKILLVTFILIQSFAIKSFSGEIINLQLSTTKFSSTKLTVKQALDELDLMPEISIFYGSKEEFLKLNIILSSQLMTVQKALDEIRQQAPVDIVFNNDHIIVKARTLEGRYEIRGIVKDAVTKEGLPAATVFLKGTTIGSFTDNRGSFTMSVKPGTYQLVCRFIGYSEKQFNVNMYDNCQIDVLLEIKQNQINEVKVTGSFNDTEPIERGRPIEKIESRVIEKLNTNDVGDALHGRVNGVWTTKVSGAPGEHNKVRIRGISSIFGSTDPLYVVDGVFVPVVNFKSLGIADLNSHDVNSITVYKDASSTALYGYMGGNGVVIIETKKGGGKPSYNFSVKMGLQQFNKRYDLMNSEQFYATLDSSDKKLNTTFYKRNPQQHWYEKYPFYRDSVGNTLGYDDFQEELFKTGIISEYQLSGQGGIKGIDYYISGNYYNHNGVITNTNYNKYTLTVNLSKIILDRLSIRLLYKGSHQENKNNLDNYLGNSVILKGINYEPAFRTTPDSFLVKWQRLYYNDNNSPSIKLLSNNNITPNMLFGEQEKLKIENNNSFVLNGFYHFNKELSGRASLSLSFRNQFYSSYIPSKAQQNEMYMSSNENFVILQHQYDLNYEKVLKGHTINASLHYRNYNDNVYWKIDSLRNVDLEGLTLENEIYQRGSNAIFGKKGAVIRKINSAFLTASYNYQSKYFLSFIANFDHLKEGYYVNRSELFSSVALNWDLAKEKFFHFPSWVNSLNLYTNWGQSGNYPLNSLSNDLFDTDSKYTSADQLVRAVYISNLANHHITHEKVTEMNYGSRISLLNNRLMLSADYYRKQNSNLLVQRSIPLYYGGGTIFQNIGEMKNEGVEAGLEVIPFDRKNLYWSMKGGFSTNNQVITKLNDGQTISFNNIDVLYPDFYASENETLGSITGYSYQGKWNDLTEEQKTSKKYVQKLGMAYLKMDSTYTKILRENDKTTIGNSIPDYTFNFTNSLEIGNFSCEMLWYGVVGIDKYNATRASTFVAGTNKEVSSFVEQKLKGITDAVFYESSFFVEDASFIRLKSLSFTYKQPKKQSSKIGLSYTLSFENLVTLTTYSGYDPEATIYTDNNFTDNAMDRGSYPNPKGVYFSINLSFQ
jgi:TonB-dependent starch-binding outer membrane protein SusC